MSEINDIEELPEGTFPIKLKLIQKYQQVEPSIIAKYNNGIYHKGYFRGVSNIYLNLITCKYKIFIPPKLQSYILHWCHTYILRPGMEIIEAMIFQHFYCPDIINAV